MGSLTPGWDSSRPGLPPKEYEDHDEAEEAQRTMKTAFASFRTHKSPSIPVPRAQSLQRRSLPLEGRRSSLENQPSSFKQTGGRPSLDHTDSWWRRMDCGGLNENPDLVVDKTAARNGFVPQFSVTGQKNNYASIAEVKE